MIFFLYLGQFFTQSAATYFDRQYGRKSSKLSDYLIYEVVSGLVAMCFFSISSGLSFSFNLRTVIYSCTFATVVILTKVFTLLRLRFMNIIHISLIFAPLSLTITFVSGWLFFDESFTYISAIRLILSFASALLAYFRNGAKKAEKEPDSTFKLCLALTVLLAITNMASTVIQKFFALDPQTTDANSMFFLTNVFIVAICLLSLLICRKGKLSRALADFKDLGFSRYKAVTINTIASNIGSVLNIQILSMVPISIHTPVGGALSNLSTAAVSCCVKEKVPVIPVIISLISTLLAFFEL